MEQLQSVSRPIVGLVHARLPDITFSIKPPHKKHVQIKSTLTLQI